MPAYLGFAAAIILSAPVQQVFASEEEKPLEIVYPFYPPAPALQTQQQADAKSSGCTSCHTDSDAATMHDATTVILGCTDCHGGDATVVYSGKPEGLGRHDGDDHDAGHDDEHADDHGKQKAKKQKDDHGKDYGGAHRSYSPGYQAAMEHAHVMPSLPGTWHFPSSANPAGSYALLNREAKEYVRFVNPSDYRVASEACGACHQPIIDAAVRSIMATGAMLWGGAAYNNGIVPCKNYILGEAYTPDGTAAAIAGRPVAEETQVYDPLKACLADWNDPDSDRLQGRGVLKALFPLPAWETIKPADVFRVFERGGRNIVNLFPETGLPNSRGQLQRIEEPGRPDFRQSNRGPGTGGRIAVPVLNIHKTRLNDPLMWFLGTNDNPGDFRTSGCGACHVVYANDRDPRHSRQYAKFGHTGKTQTVDPTIPHEEPGHPLEHRFTTAIPTSQCMICHMHQPNIFLNSYLGYTMWDYESDAPHMWPEEQRYPDAHEMREILDRNPEGAAVRGKWSDPEFLRNVSDLNPELSDTQFADYHGHGWNFRAIFKRDREGRLLDADNNVVSDEDPDKFSKAVHMSSLHLDVGMHCVDCHFAQDTHGNGHLYGEVANAIEIDCIDCHGTADAYPSLVTSGPAAPPFGNDLSLLTGRNGKKRFEWVGNKLIQRSVMDPDLEWEVSLVRDSVQPGHPEYNEKSARAKLMSRDTANLEWGQAVTPEERAHGDDNMECYTCHLSWTTSCAGCHLPIEANWKTAMHHYDGETTRNYATYNPQVARDQMFQLGRRGKINGGRIAPVRSTSALVLSSTNANREKIYVQQPPIAASGFSSQAFAPHFPHTVRKTETKTCTDCHLSQENDNNAIMAQLLLLGTNFVNFVGYHAYVGTEAGIEAVQVTEWEEPQAVIGSYLHRYAYPDWYNRHQGNDRQLQTGYRHGAGVASCLQLRGEYLFAAVGRGGTRAYDVAGIANKGISQRMITAPFAPTGHDTRIASRNATCVALPTNQAIAPDKNQGDLMRVVNQEQPFHPIYNYALITDAEEGLIIVNVNTLADGEFRNNKLKRALTWNENGVLDGARHLTIGGYFVYVMTPDRLVILDLNDPLQPRLVETIAVKDGRATALQFRYLFVTDAFGLWTVDVTDPRQPRRVPDNIIRLTDPQRVYVARTYAYVAAGPQGLAIIDTTQPEQLRLQQIYNADGALADARDVIVGSTNATQFAYVADGSGGLKVIQLTAPDTQPRFYGFSPEPRPNLVAYYPTRKPALALSKGLDRDRAVDETGGQMAVFGRLGSRPLTQDEMKKLYIDDNGNPWFVTDEPEKQ
ncbi:MAG: hypothetical protein KJO54_11970 [Gammaproteobacteria bacterium]|nr:hypothetical protein [Gammaproteobacteria bacterium]